MAYSLPFELLLNAFLQLESSESKLTCSTVCKEWYQPAFRALYYDLYFNSLYSFRTFLNAAARHTQQPGKYVRRLTLDTVLSDDIDNETATNNMSTDSDEERQGEEAMFYMDQQTMDIEKTSTFVTKEGIFMDDENMIFLSMDVDDENDQASISSSDSNSSTLSSEFDRNSMTFVPLDFELLAILCPNLKDLLFNDTQCWYCLNELDLTRFLKQLRRVPILHNNALSRSVFEKLKDRLTSLELYHFHPFLHEQLPLIRRCTMDGHRFIKPDLLDRLHQSAPQLQDLCCKIDIRQPPAHIDYSNKVSAAVWIKQPHFFKSLQCYLYDTNSIWFSLIRAHYYAISTLTLNITPRFTSDSVDLSLTSATDYIRQVFDLTRYTSIPCVNVIFEGYAIELDFIRCVTFGFINNYNMMRHYCYSSVEVHFSYSTMNTLPEYMPAGNYAADTSYVNYTHYRQTTTIPKQYMKHRFDFEVVMKNKRRRWLDDGCATLLKAIVKPVNLKTQYLTVTRVQHEATVVVDWIRLDSLLRQFPKLTELSISVYCQACHCLVVSSSSVQMASIGFTPLLRVLGMENVQLDQTVYAFLLECCPNLARLRLKRCCPIEQDIIDRLRYQHNVHVQIVA
ncbi:MAG: hypothetical protein EXX96DRAFT_623823 [Benjaminiella poitrasii]|nr:MAG: hypothetical protein EXX96DRAFT_623823 [Benjaminiella poitrasii]